MVGIVVIVVVEIELVVALVGMVVVAVIRDSEVLAGVIVCAEAVVGIIVVGAVTSGTGARQVWAAVPAITFGIIVSVSSSFKQSRSTNKKIAVDSSIANVAEIHTTASISHRI